MRVRKFGHSCLLLEERGESLLFDPGGREFLDDNATPETFAGVSVVALTHWHPDHADPQLIGRIVERSGARVLSTREGEPGLRAAGVEATVPGEGTLSIGAFTLRLTLVPHAAILGADAPGNLAYLVNDRLLNPGDSFDARLAEEYGGVAALALPVTAPWMAELEAAAFAERLTPGRVLPVHDGYVKDFFRTRRYQTYQQYFQKKGIGFEGAVEAGLDL